MKLLERFLVAERTTLMDNRVRLVHAGRRARLPKSVLGKLDATIEMTVRQRRHGALPRDQLCGRQEIADAVRAIAGEVARGELAADEVTEETVQQHLYRPDLPDPDL
jgi:undecaprenyl diphosphate synthase